MERGWRRINAIFYASSCYDVHFLCSLARFKASMEGFLKSICTYYLVVSVERCPSVRRCRKARQCYECNCHSLVCFSWSLALFPSPTILIISQLSHICFHIDVSVFMNMDESPNSSKDACMVESVSSPRGDGKRQ